MTSQMFIVVIFVVTSLETGIAGGKTLHGSDCDITSPSCEAGTFCWQNVKNKTVCLCHVSEYRNDDKQCVSSGGLYVCNITTLKVTYNSIKLFWSSQNIRKVSAKFNVSYDPDKFYIGDKDGITLRNLDQNKEYEFHVTVYIPGDLNYFPRVGPAIRHSARTTQRPKAHGEQCESGAGSCKIGTTCEPDKEGQLRCLCDKYNNYWNDNEECVSTGQLKISDIYFTDVTASGATLSWSRGSINKRSAQFKVNYGTNDNLYVNTSQITVNDLKPDTIYTFSIDVYIPSELYYTERKGPLVNIKIRTGQRTSTFTSASSSFNMLTSINVTRENNFSSPSGTTTALTFTSSQEAETVSPTQTNVSSTQDLSIKTEKNEDIHAVTTPSLNSLEILTNDRENTIYIAIAVSVVASLVLVLAIILFVRRRKLQDVCCKKPEEHLSQPEDVYTEVDATSKQKADKSSRKIENVQSRHEEAVSSPEKLTEKPPMETYASENKVSKYCLPVSSSNDVSIQVHNDVSQTKTSDSAVYSHLTNSSIQRSRESENVYDG